MDLIAYADDLKAFERELLEHYNALWEGAEYVGKSQSGAQVRIGAEAIKKKNLALILEEGALSAEQARCLDDFMTHFSGFKDELGVRLDIVIIWAPSNLVL